MVQVRTIVRALLVAVIAVSASTTTSVYAEDAASQTEVVELDEKSCMAPDVVTRMETKLESLEKERAQWESQFVGAAGKWKSEKMLLEDELAQQQAIQEKATTDLQKVQQEAATSVTALQQKIRESEKQHADAIEELKTETQSLLETVEELKTQLATQKQSLGKKDTEIAESRTKLLKFVDQVKALERDVAKSRKKNEALRVELSDMGEKLTISSLLSSYYDEGVELAGDALNALRVQLDSTQQGAAGVTQALEALESYKVAVCATTDKLYAEHLAATLDPIIADLRKAADPHVKKYQPVVEAQYKKIKRTALKSYNQTLKRARAARAEAIALLKQQNEGLAPYAQQIVDGSLFVLAAPFVLLLVRLVLSLTWTVVRTMLCIVTLGFCCGACAKKRSKPKRKASRKAVPSSPQPAAAAASTNTTSSGGGKKSSSSSNNSNNSSNNGGKRSGNKKQK